MEITEVTAEKLKDVFEGIRAGHEKGHEDNCPTCKLEMMMIKMPEIQRVVASVLYDSGITGNLPSFVSLVTLGFLLSWELRNSLELEKLYKL